MFPYYQRIGKKEIRMGGPLYLACIRHGTWPIDYQKWVTPEKYYVSFPHSAFNIYALREERPHILHHKNNYFLSHKGEDRER